MNLDKFLQTKETELTFTIQDKEYKADVSSLALIRLGTMDENLSLSEMAIKTFEIVFGEQNAKELFKKLNQEGIAVIQEEITKHLTDNTEQEKK